MYFISHYYEYIRIDMIVNQDNLLSIHVTKVYSDLSEQGTVRTEACLNRDLSEQGPA